jgi:hypothetical protein
MQFRLRPSGPIAAPDITPPGLVGAVINAPGTLLTLTYSKTLNASSVPTLAIAGTLLAALTGVATVTGSTVTQALAPGVIAGETGITVTTSGAPIQDAAGNNATPLVAQAVTNNSARAAIPADVSGLVFQGDLNDPATFTQSAGVITTFTNKVSAVAVTPVNSPAYSAVGLNSKPTIDYDGASYLVGTEAAVAAAGVNAAARSIFIVAAFDSIDVTTDALFSWGNSGVSSTRTWWYGQSITGTGRMNVVFNNDAAASVTVSGTIQTDTTAHVYSLISPGTTVATWIDNVADIPSAAFDPATNTVNRFGISARVDAGPDTGNDGRNSETLVYNRAVTTAERNYINALLKTKWGTP